MREILIQYQSADLAIDALDVAVQKGRPVHEAFAAVQSVLAAAAMVSKLLWPQPPTRQVDGSELTPEQESERRVAIERGRFLRTELGIRSVPVLESRRVRNAIEHFDQRLDSFLASKEGMIVDLNIAAKATFIVGGNVRYLRHLDPYAGTVSVLDDEVSIQELFSEFGKVAKSASDWLGAHNEQAEGG
jgi:hypothetical protein